MNGLTPSLSVAPSVQHPDNLLDTGRLPSDLEVKLRTEGIRFATQLRTSSGHAFLLCGYRCPREAGAAMLRDALRAGQRRNPIVYHYDNAEKEI